MARRMPADRSLNRGRAKSQPKSKIIVFCEGSVTEPTYINAFANSYRNGLVSVEPIGGAGVPKSVVRAAVARKADLLLEAKKSVKTGFEMYFEVWAAFDRDSHEVE